MVVAAMIDAVIGKQGSCYVPLSHLSLALVNVTGCLH